MSAWHYYYPLPRQSPCCHHQSPHVMHRTKLTEKVTDIHGLCRGARFRLVPTSNLLDCSLLRQRRGIPFEATNHGISQAVWSCTSPA
jgi:hypothetical protein